ncbi:LptA/OstA family protein [Leptothoe sp. PORK10 BA2]|uniref:LptA/OstA family protein n=1 Tax=Leptothoe sp. PORK10 BA2 TaxID=3110254 RepID=UPI002B20A03C|nr:LptA/OstA family protein [Leptothoe sp. PORK10 BA2]MEA5462921.1 LptA/OstA family protein [Leptothoe sp. PORK10 BA2]
MVLQRGHKFRSRFPKRLRYLGAGVWALFLVAANLVTPSQAQSGGSIKLRADVQEADANTGIITARGNVKIDYPEEAIYATSAQAQYYSRERRIILTGNVFVQQEANTLQAEVVTYLIDQGRFVATPNANEQVESVYVLPEPTDEPAAAPEPEPLTPLPVLPEELPDFAIPTDE